MNFTINQIRPGCWEMLLLDALDEYPDMVWSIRQEFRHDRLVELVLEELLAWEGVMYSRQAYDKWHWYDKAEMDRFVTYMLLKHSGQ